MDWRTVNICGPYAMPFRQQSLKKKKSRTHTATVSPNSRRIQIPGPTFVGRGLVIPQPVYPKAKMWVAGFLEVSSWSIRDNYGGSGH